MFETFTVADAYLYTMLRWGNRFGLNTQLWPNLDAKYYELHELGDTWADVTEGPSSVVQLAGARQFRKDLRVTLDRLSRLPTAPTPMADS